jgi:chromosomal replication initiation ATPase DnaA
MIVTIKELLDVAAEVTGCDRLKLSSSCRKAELVVARDACYALAKQYMSRTDASISEEFGRERSTITHAMKRHYKRIERDRFYRNIYNKIGKEAGLID